MAASWKTAHPSRFSTIPAAIGSRHFCSELWFESSQFAFKFYVTRYEEKHAPPDASLSVTSSTGSLHLRLPFLAVLVYGASNVSFVGRRQPHRLGPGSGCS